MGKDNCKTYNQQNVHIQMYKGHLQLSQMRENSQGKLQMVLD